MPDNHDRPDGADRPTERTRTASEPQDTESTTRIPRVPDESDAERTEQLSAVPADFTDFPLGETQSIPVVRSDAGWTGNLPSQPTRRRRRGLVRAGITAGAVAGALALFYVADLAFSSGTVPRGTVVAGVPIGGLDKTAAERELRQRLGPGLHDPVELQAGDQVAALPPDRAGLRMDWAATVEQAGSQPLNPFTRLASLFTVREVAPVSRGDREQLVRALHDLAPRLDREAAEGTIRFEGAKPIPVEPVTGQHVDVEAAADVVLNDWAKNGPVRLPIAEQPVTTTSDGVRRALHEVAEPAVAAPVSVRGEGTDAVLAPEAIAAALRFEPDGKGGLASHVDVPTAVGAVEPQLRDTTRPGRDAEIVLEGAAPVVHPSENGRGIDWGRSFEPLPEVLRRPRDRSVQAVYVDQPPKLTTEQADQLGVREVVGEFTTGGFEPASGANIRRVAEQVNGALIKPGETFSLNGHTGPRGVAQGYVESGVIENGRPARAVGGGISQFATTLYNASYFAGMKDVEHKAHSYYISRYPAGREATVFQNPDGSSVIDVKFRNVARSGILITTRWTPSSITVTLWGTKQFDVTSQTSERSDVKPPQEKVVPPGEPCSPSKGNEGFTVYDTRTIRDITNGQVSTERKKTVYNPQPIIHCGPPPP